MNETEKLLEICEKIGYDLFSRKEVEGTSQSDGAIYTVFVDKDVREIIFTQDFINKCLFHINVNDVYKIFLHLDNPVDYLYNLLLNEEEKGK